MYRILLFLCLFTILWMYRVSDLQQFKLFSNPIQTIVSNNCERFIYIKDLIITPSQKFCESKNICAGTTKSANRTSGKPFIIIIVTSHVKHVKMRNLLRTAIPREYLQSMNTVRLFLLGKIPPNKQLNQSSIEEESYTFKDILQGSFLEDYRNLTYKHLMGLQWVSTNCKEATYILKVDDDIVFNLQRIFKYLKKRKLTGDFLLGYWHKYHNRYPKRGKLSKWYVDRAEYSRKVYPQFLSGSYYVTTPEVAGKLANEATHHPYFWIDDVFITGVLAEALNIKLEQLPKEFWSESDINKNIHFNRQDWDYAAFNNSISELLRLETNKDLKGKNL